MPVSNAHFYLNWAKERIDEMDAALASIESKAADIRADTGARAEQFITDLRKTRDEFESTLKKQATEGEAAWENTKIKLESEWATFESEIKKYLETVGKSIGQQQAVFQGQVEAQMKAWRAAADEIHASVTQFAADRREDIDTTVARMKTDAATAQEKLQKLAQAGTDSWSALSSALAETRAAFDRANQAARDAFKQATR